MYFYLLSNFIKLTYKFIVIWLIVNTQQDFLLLILLSLVTHGFSNLDTVQEIDADFLNAVVDTPLTLQLTLRSSVNK